MNEPTSTHLLDPPSMSFPSSDGQSASNDLSRLFGEAKNASFFSSHEETARLGRGLDSRETQVKDPERGLLHSGIDGNGSSNFQYDPQQRTDGLVEFEKRVVVGGAETAGSFAGRADGLVFERKLLTIDARERELKFDPAARPDGKIREHEMKTTDGAVDLQFSVFDPRFRDDGLSRESTSRENGTTKTTRNFEGHPHGLVSQAIFTNDAGVKKVNHFSDGRRQESASLPDGTILENREYDKDGKLIIPGLARLDSIFGKGASTDRYTEARLRRYEEQLMSANFVLSPIEKGWGLYQSLEQAARESGRSFTLPELKEHALRIRNRELQNSDRVSFKPNEQFSFYSNSEMSELIAQRRALLTLSVIPVA